MTNESTATLDDLAEFLMEHPTLTHQRRALGKDGRLASVEEVDIWIGSKISLVGEKLLDSIHTENFLALSQPERDAIVAELELVTNSKETVITINCDETGKPELTADYLRSIGKADYIEWGTDRN